MNKRIRRAAPSQAVEKRPRGAQLVDVSGLKFAWRVDLADHEGPWGWQLSDVRALFADVIPRLHNFETMTWTQIDGPTGSHFVAVDDLCPDAQARLREIGRDENEQLFSLRLSGKVRVWGVRDIAILRLIWWDPDHSVCPSQKKHT